MFLTLKQSVNDTKAKCECVPKRCVEVKSVPESKVCRNKVCIKCVESEKCS